MINIFDVRTGKVMRDFKGSADDFAIGGAGGVTGVSWPVFKYKFNFSLNIFISRSNISISASFMGLMYSCYYLFRWSGGRDDKYFARMGKNILSVYETDTFSLIDKKSLKVENIMDFCWSPTDPIIALFVPEMGGGNQPARVNLCFSCLLCS